MAAASSPPVPLVVSEGLRPAAVTDSSKCVSAPEEHSWRQIICSPTPVNIEAALSPAQINCCGKGSVVSFLRARNSAPALRSCSLAAGAGAMTDHMLAWLSLAQQPRPSVRASPGATIQGLSAERESWAPSAFTSALTSRMGKNQDNQDS